MPNIPRNTDNGNPFRTEHADVSSYGIPVSPQLATHRFVDDRRSLFTGYFVGKKLTSPLKTNAECTQVVLRDPSVLGKEPAVFIRHTFHTDIAC